MTDSSNSEKKGLQHGSENCYDGWFGNGFYTLKKTGSRAGGCSGEDVRIFIGSNLKGEGGYIRGTAQVEQFGDKR